ncbi:MAG: DUF5063 domain-containing protein [Actinomycetota bacterium]|nr:DUF5063 domain-containing protein [Actinomycetota bacterium]
MSELSTGFDADEFGREIAAAATDFLGALQTISRADDPGSAVPLLLIEVSQILFAGARLGAQQDFTPIQEYQPDVGPDPDLDAMRLRLARLLDSVDTYSYNFDPYVPEIVASQLSDDLTSIATDLANGLRHFRRGNLAEALWWWQFSYVSTWGGNASAVLRALQSVVAHDRLDLDVTDALEEEQIAAAQAALDGETPRT